MAALCSPIQFDEDPTALYRLYEASNAVIYVGITSNPAKRMARHAETQPWWPEVVRKTMVWYPTRDEAAEAETAAIDAEKPKYNLIKNSHPNVGRWGSAGYRRTAEDLLEDLEAAWKAGEWVDLGFTRFRCGMPWPEAAPRLIAGAAASLRES